MKLIGGLLLLFAALLYERRYTEERSREARDTAAVLRMLLTVKSELSVFRKPLFEILKSYTDASLAESGFLPAVVGGTPPEKAAERLSLTAEGREVLSRLFLALGREYSRAAMEAVGAATAFFEKESERLQSALPKKKKVARTLLLTGGLSFLILIL